MKFTIGFEKEDTEKLHKFWDEITQSHLWSEGKFTKMFEEKWSEHNNTYAVAFSGWGGAALSALEFYNVKNKTLLCPTNTFMSIPLRVKK